MDCAGRSWARARVSRRRAAVLLAVAIIAIPLAGCTDDGSDKTGSTESDAPELRAEFDYDVEYDDTPDPTYCPAREVRFTDESSGEPTEWSWDFPDGSTSSERSPTFDLREDRLSGTGEVTLTVSRGGEEDEITRTVTTVVC